MKNVEVHRQSHRAMDQEPAGSQPSTKTRSGTVVGYDAAVSNLADAFTGEVGIAVKIILVEGVLNADDRVLLAVAAVLLLQLRASLDLLWIRVLGLEVQVVLVVLKELAGSNVHANLHLAHISSFLHVTNMHVVPRMLSNSHAQMSPAAAWSFMSSQPSCQSTQSTCKATRDQLLMSQKWTSPSNDASMQVSMNTCFSSRSGLLKSKCLLLKPSLTLVFGQLSNMFDTNKQFLASCCCKMVLKLQ